MKQFALIMVWGLLFFSSCTNDELKPSSIDSLTISDINYFSVKISYHVSWGNSKTIKTGIIISNGNNQKTIMSNNFDELQTISIEDLNHNTEYHIRAFIEENNNVVYSNEKTFKTREGIKPIIEKLKLEGREKESIDITFSTKYSEYACEKKIVISDNKEMNGARTIDYILNNNEKSINITGLTPNRLYYILAYASNIFGETKSDTLIVHTKSLNGLWKGVFVHNSFTFGVSVSIGNDLYFGLDVYQRERWHKYNIVTHEYTRLSDFPIPENVEHDGTRNFAIFASSDIIYAYFKDGSFWKYIIDKNQWEKVGNCPIGSINRPQAVSDGEIAVVGGGLWKKEIWLFDIKNNLWSQLESCPVTCERGAIFLIDKKVYVLSDSHDKSIYELDINKNKWTKKTIFPGANIQDFAFFSIGNNCYIVAGQGSSSCINETWEYNTLHDEWTQKTNFPSSIMWAAGTSINNKGLVGGGVGAGHQFNYTFYMYDPDNE